MIDSLLIANRGEIARRIVRTTRRLGIRSVAIHSEADAGMPFVTEADEAICVGPANPAQSYRNTEAILAANPLGFALFSPIYADPVRPANSAGSCSSTRTRPSSSATGTSKRTGPSRNRSGRRRRASRWPTRAPRRPR